MSKIINITVPQKWEQISRAQLFYIARLYLAGLTETDFLTRALCCFAGLKSLGFDTVRRSHVFRYKKEQLYIGNQEVYFFIRSLSWLFSITLTTNLVPSFRIGLRRWYGPSNKCYNLTLNEYLHAETALYAYEVTKRFKHIDRLCAVLYRTTGHGSHDGDRRRAFNDYTYMRSARLFRLLPRYKRMAVFIFYTGCRRAFVDAFPYLFSKGSASAPVNPAPEIQRMVRVLNDGDVTKNKTILNTPVWEALAQLNDMAEAVKRQNKQANGKV